MDFSVNPNQMSYFDEGTGCEDVRVEARMSYSLQ